jgi:hypothetical protein
VRHTRSYSFKNHIVHKPLFLFFFLQGPDHQVESIQLRTDEYEMIIAQYGNYTLVVIQGSTMVMDMFEQQEAFGAVDEKNES